MARFYDYAMRESHKWKDSSLVKMMGEATVIDGTSLSDYLFINEAKGEWNLLEDFPNIAPPFQKFWVECRAPREILTPKGLIPWPHQLPQEWGVLFSATEISTLSDTELWQIPSARTPGAKWVLQAILFTRHLTHYQDNTIRPLFSWWFPVMADGRQVKAETERERSMQITYTTFPGDDVKYAPEDEATGRGMLSLNDQQLERIDITAVDGGSMFWYPNGEDIDIFKPNDTTSEQWKQRQKTHGYFMVMSMASDIHLMKPGWVLQFTDKEEQLWLPLLQPCLLTISFLHCKNIKMERMEPSRPIQKKAMKKHGQPLCNYHILQIQPMKAVLESEGGVSQTGIRKALHICRGHFATYDVKPLFGRLKGTFWIPQHLRGNIDEGMTDKTYKVKEPVHDNQEH